MVRTLLLVTATACCLSLLGTSPVQAATAPPPAAAENEKKPIVERIKVPTSKGTVEFVVNENTEVRLDGKLCELNDVPDDAVIIRLEVSALDDTTVFKIHFRSKK